LEKVFPKFSGGHRFGHIAGGRGKYLNVKYSFLQAGPGNLAAAQKVLQEGLYVLLQVLQIFQEKGEREFGIGFTFFLPKKNFLNETPGSQSAAGNPEKGALLPGTHKMKSPGHLDFSRPFLPLNEDRKPGGGEFEGPFPLFRGNPAGMQPFFDPVFLQERF